MYLDFDEYEDYGGAITDEALYERLKFRSRKHLDKTENSIFYPKEDNDE